MTAHSNSIHPPLTHHERSLVTVTNIHIEITEDTRPPTRRHVQVPAEDQLVNDWFDAQRNQSASVRLLIRDEVRQHGYGDRVTREKFGSPAAQAAAPAPAPAPAAAAASTPPAAARTSASAPASQQASATPPATQVVPTAVPAATAASGMLTIPDHRDLEIEALNAQLETLRAEVGPLQPFLDALRRDGISAADLLSRT